MFGQTHRTPLQKIQVFLFMTLSARILFKIQCSLRNLMKVASPTLPLDMQTVVLEWLKYVAVCPFEPARCFRVVGEPPAYPLCNKMSTNCRCDFAVDRRCHASLLHLQGEQFACSSCRGNAKVELKTLRGLGRGL